MRSAEHRSDPLQFELRRQTGVLIHDMAVSAVGQLLRQPRRQELDGTGIRIAPTSYYPPSIEGFDNVVLCEPVRLYRHSEIGRLGSIYHPWMRRILETRVEVTLGRSQHADNYSRFDYWKFGRWFDLSTDGFSIDHSVDIETMDKQNFSAQRTFLRTYRHIQRTNESRNGADKLDVEFYKRQIAVAGLIAHTLFKAHGIDVGIDDAEVMYDNWQNEYPDDRPIKFGERYWSRLVPSDGQGAIEA